VGGKGCEGTKNSFKKEVDSKYFIGSAEMKCPKNVGLSLHVSVLNVAMRICLEINSAVNAEAT